jgi:hypothetical protein
MCERQRSGLQFLASMMMPKLRRWTSEQPVNCVGGPGDRDKEEGPQHAPSNPSAFVVVGAERLTRLVLRTAPGVLELALGLIGLAFVRHLGITEQVARGFLELAAHLLGAAVGAILVYAGGGMVVACVMIAHLCPPFELWRVQRINRGFGRDVTGGVAGPVSGR